MSDLKPAPVKPEAPLSVLESLDVRVGGIVAVEDVPGSSKLVRLVVDFGDHRRNILAGLKRERANPGEMAKAAADLTNVICHELLVTDHQDFVMVFLRKA